MVRKPNWFGRGIENEEYIIKTFGDDTEEWKEATKRPKKYAKN